MAAPASGCNCIPAVPLVAPAAQVKPICPTSDYLKKISTLDGIEAFLNGTGNDPFGGFRPTTDIAKKDDGDWRVFLSNNAEKGNDGKYFVKNLEGQVCNASILLKSIINQINASTEVAAMNKGEDYKRLTMSGKDDQAVDKVVINNKEELPAELRDRLEALVRYLNTHARA